MPYFAQYFTAVLETPCYYSLKPAGTMPPRFYHFQSFNQVNEDQGNRINGERGQWNVRSQQVGSLFGNYAVVLERIVSIILQSLLERCCTTFLPFQSFSRAVE